MTNKQIITETKKSRRVGWQESSFLTYFIPP
jgi:hypothetical protein